MLWFWSTIYGVKNMKVTFDLIMLSLKFSLKSASDAEWKLAKTRLAFLIQNTTISKVIFRVESFNPEADHNHRGSAPFLTATPPGHTKPAGRVALSVCVCVCVTI